MARKLSPTDVTTMSQLYRWSDLTYEEIADLYGVCRWKVWDEMSQLGLVGHYRKRGRRANSNVPGPR